MYCNNCGKQIIEMRKFCPECGAKIGTDSPVNTANYSYPQAPLQNFSYPVQRVQPPPEQAKQKEHGPIAKVYFKLVWGLGWLMFGFSVLFLLACFSLIDVELSVRAMMFCQSISIFCGILYLWNDMKKGGILMVATGGSLIIMYIIAYGVMAAAGIA